MYVLIDSNIFIANYSMEYAAFKMFCKHFPEKKTDVFISKVTYLEVINSQEKDLTEVIRNFNKAVKILNRTNTKKFDYLAKDFEKQEKENYKKYFKKVITENNIRVLNFPNIPHEKVLEYYYQHKRPFDYKDAGYKDFLIWASVKELLQKDLRPVVLITQDGDFMDKKGSIHQDLIQDLQSESIQADRLSVVKSINEFNDKYLKDVYHLVKARELFEDPITRNSLFDLVKVMAEPELMRFDLNQSDIKISRQFQDLSISEIYEFDNFEISEIDAYLGDLINVKVEFDINCLITFNVDSSIVHEIDSSKLYTINDQVADWTFDVEGNKNFLVEALIQVKEDLNNAYWFEIINILDAE